MAQAFVPGLQVRRNAVIRRVRDLPVPGEVLVQPGARVEGEQVVASAYLPGELLVLRLPEKLGIESFEVLRGLRIEKGQEVTRGQLLCEHKGFFGLFKSRFTAPETGVIEFITERTGHVGLRLPSRPIELRAHLGGTVAAVVPGKSVTIEAHGAFIQGIFGVGGERRGRLHALDVAAGEPITETHIPDTCAGLVLAGGTSPTTAAILKAAHAGAQGLIVGSIDDRALKAYLGYDLGIALTGDEAIPMTLIITEGFGSIPLAVRTAALVRELHGRKAALNGATQVRAGALRPEILVSGEAAGGEETVAAEAFSQGLRTGSRVRIIRVPYFGSLATVVELPSAAQKIETGAVARVLRAKLDGGEEIVVPRANVELV